MHRMFQTMLSAEWYICNEQIIINVFLFSVVDLWEGPEIRHLPPHFWFKTDVCRAEGPREYFVCQNYFRERLPSTPPPPLPEGLNPPLA